jgi:hypothetical protein
VTTEHRAKLNGIMQRALGLDDVSTTTHVADLLVELCLLLAEIDEDELGDGK